MDKSLYEILKDNPRISEKEVEEFYTHCYELGIAKEYLSKYFKIWKVDTTAHKLVFDNVVGLNCSSEIKYVVAKTIIENKLLLKPMGGDLPGETVPQFIRKMVEMYNDIHKDENIDANIHYANFYYNMIPNLPISIIVKLSKSQEFNSWTETDKFELYYQLVKLLEKDTTSNNIRMLVDYYLPDRTKTHQLTLDELVTLCD